MNDHATPVDNTPVNRYTCVAGPCWAEWRAWLSAVRRRPAREVWLPALALVMVVQGGHSSSVALAQGDAEPPSIVNHSPAVGATNVSTQISVQASFDEPVQPASIAFVLRDANNVIVPATVSYDSATRTATLDPDNDLPGTSTYTATLSGAVDLAGNAMTSSVGWSFVTANPTFLDGIVFKGLTAPTAMSFASDGRVFVAEKSGVIKVFASLSAGTPTLFADLRTKVYNYWDRGLLGMALDPAFPIKPYVYVLYTYDGDIGGPAPKWNDDCPTPPGPTTNGCTASARLSRLEANGNVMTGTEQVLIGDWFQQFPSHSIGTLMFGEDGALYASGGEGASFTAVDYGQFGNPGGDPLNEGGALRSQDLRTSGDPVTLDGSIIRIDPDTGAALPDNPLFGHADVNAKRIVAYGLRNPFRFTTRPGTRELWVGDVGLTTWEEINRVLDPIAAAQNFGWPCYEGGGQQGGYAAANLGICQGLYNTAGVVTPPFYTYNHADNVVPGESCTTGSSSISGMAFYRGGSYATAFDRALFFADYSRKCIWVMFKDVSGDPDPSHIATFVAGAKGPIQLQIGPGGDLFYVALDEGTIRRVRYFSGNRPPTAEIDASAVVGSAPMSVSFDGSRSSDPEGQALAYAWDLDGDGSFNDATGPQTSYTYGSGAHLVQLKVTDDQGLSEIDSILITVDNAYPTATIATPSATATWSVGDVISFSGSAVDPEDGQMPASRLTWSLVIHHCPSTCHTHAIQDFLGVASGAFVAPDHEYYSYLELILTATDSTGLPDTKSVLLYPRVVDLTFQSNPSGLQLAVGSFVDTAPFTRTVISGSTNSISAVSPQTVNSTIYQFASWSDGGAQSHPVVAGSSPRTYTANFATPPPSITSLTPTSGAVGTAVTIAGTNLGTTQGTSTVRFNGTDGHADKLERDQHCGAGAKWRDHGDRGGDGRRGGE